MTFNLPNRSVPEFIGMRGVVRFSPAQFLEFDEADTLEPHARYELLDGYIVHRLYHTPPHASTQNKLTEMLLSFKFQGFSVQSGRPLVLLESVPLPDLCILRMESKFDYDHRHPGAEDCEIAIDIYPEPEELGRTTKLAIYSRNKVPVYWIVNLADRCVEVHQVPNGTEAKPKYKTRKVFKEGQSVPVVLGGLKVGAVAVSEILPRPRKSSPSARR